MLTLLAVSLLGIILGILVGLFPVLPIWIGPVLLVPFIGSLDLVHILTFFLTIAIGSQYFGSVATLLTGVPGETSSLSYSEDVRYLTYAEKLTLIKDTAWASFITSIISLSFTYILFASIGPELAELTSFKIQWWVLAICVVAIIGSSKNVLISASMMLLGILLTNKTHPDLPVWVIKNQTLTNDLTVFLVTMAAVIVPSMLFAKDYRITSERYDQVDDHKLEKEKIKPIVQGGILGYLIGFMPGPAAMMSSIIAYRWPKKNTSEGIIRAESANNSAIIAETVPFMGLGIPINTTAVLVFSLISMKLIAWPSSIYQPVFGTWPVYAVVFATAILTSVVFFYLSTRFLHLYRWLLETMGTRINWVWLSLVGLMICLDLYVSSVHAHFYMLWASLMAVIGYLLYQYRVSGVALVFGYVLGDRIIWSVMQTLEYYF